MNPIRNVVLVLLDSLNRHMLGCYGGTEFATPNIDRLAARSVRFTRHYVGSLPCMPARHDILTGALDFLWKPWGSVEIWEDAITARLSAAGVTSQLITDHPHLFERGGENYHVDFTAWDYQRGGEGDAWKTKADPSWAGAPSFGRGRMPYDNSRGYFRGEADFPGPRTLAAGARWLEENAGQHERFFLMIDEFDPHEPFDTPEPFASQYDPDWEGPHLIWPPYVVGGIAKGVLTEREGAQVRASYGGKLTMIDKWLGVMLDALDARRLWDDTLVVLVTDHGHYHGEKDIWGKLGAPLYQPMAYIPATSWRRARRERLATATPSPPGVDLHATLQAVFVVAAGAPSHPWRLASAPAHRRAGGKQARLTVLAGVWGREVHLIERDLKYVRAPAGANAPLAMYSNRWSTMPTHVLPLAQELPLPDARAVLARMPGSEVPVLRQIWQAGDAVPYWAASRFVGHQLFDLGRGSRTKTPTWPAGRAKPRRQPVSPPRLRAIQAPEVQFQRLGLESLG